MSFDSASKVSQTIHTSDSVDLIRQQNRAKIDNLFNSAPPLDADRAKKQNVKINVNWGEAPRIAQHARRQYNNAFLRPGSDFFKVSIPCAPVEKRLDWGLFITNALNRPLKRALPYFETMRGKFASVVLHGIGPTIWEDADSWCPTVVPLEDLRVPTDTLLDFSNLTWFAIRKPYTPGELAKKAWSKYNEYDGNEIKSGWNKDVIKKILKEYHKDDPSAASQNINWLDNPEKMADLYKQNGGFYSSDAVDTINLWHFFYLDDSNPSKCVWRLKIVPDTGVRGKTDGDFIYDCGKKVYATELSHFFHCQFGDLSNKAPFKFHSVRSLGFMLMEPCFWTNLLRCRTIQHVFENLNTWFRNTDPAGKAKAQKVELFDRAFLPEGVSIVPQGERHQVNGDLINFATANLRQLMAEASATYTQEADTGTNKEQTATETMAKVSAVNATLSGLLLIAFNYEMHSYLEICRRFCKRNSEDKDVKKFQKQCKAYGIPSSYLNPELWDVDPVIPMGAGNPLMEISMAKEMLAMKPMFGPEAQQEILHEATAAITGDPKKASRWAPVNERAGVTDAQQAAEFAFGTLMQGVPIRIKEGLSVIEQAETLLGLLAGKIAMIEQSGNMTDQSGLNGMQNVASYISQLIQMLEQDEQQKPVARQFADDLGNLTNILNGFAQRLAEQQQAQGGGLAPEAMAKITALQTEADAKARIAEANAAQKRMHKEIQAQQNEERKDAQTISQIAREEAKAKVANAVSVAQ